ETPQPPIRFRRSGGIEARSAQIPFLRFGTTLRMLEQRRKRERQPRVARITLASRVHEGNRFRAIAAGLERQRQIESSSDIARIKRRRFLKRAHGLIET